MGIEADTMGNRIAHIFAQNDFEVKLMDIDKVRLEKALYTISTILHRQIKKEIIKEYITLAFHSMRACKEPIDVDIELDPVENDCQG